VSLNDVKQAGESWSGPQLIRPPQFVRDHVSDAVVGTDAGGAVISRNRAAEDIFGRPAATVRGAHVSEASGAQLDPAHLDNSGGMMHATCVAADGGPVIMRIAATYSRDGYVVVCVENRPAAQRAALPDCSDGNEVLLSFIDITAEQTSTVRLMHRASHDPLTMLPNRAHVLDRIGQALAQLGPPLTAVLFIDLDNLKDINGSRGHEARDTAYRPWRVDYVPRCVTMTSSPGSVATSLSTQ
jgi:hypothetical protein